MSHEETVWAETTSGGMLRQLFGYYPTLHDARVNSLNFHGEELTMDVDYRDAGAEGERSLSVRIRLIWTGLKEVELTTYDTDIAEMTFHREGDLIRTRFERGLGIAGHVVSEGFEALLEKVDPPEHDDESRLRISYRA